MFYALLTTKKLGPVSGILMFLQWRDCTSSHINASPNITTELVGGNLTAWFSHVLTLAV